jgi:stress response protein YsnF
MVSDQEMSAAIGGTAYGSDGSKLGTIEAFFADDRTGAPTWVSISTGLFGTRHSIVPVADATFADGALRIPVTAEAVKSAPSMEGAHLDPADEEALRQHYGLAGVLPVAGPPPVEPVSTDTRPVATGPRHAASAETAAAVEPPSDGAMTRSEEQLQVGTERVATTRARLVKYVVTEDVQITVPIRREEIRVEQVPLDAVDPDGTGESLEVPAGSADSSGSGLPDEIILHTERPVVTVEVVPTERVRLRVDVVEGQETISGQVQREQIVVDQDQPAVDQHTRPGVTRR